MADERASRQFIKESHKVQSKSMSGFKSTKADDTVLDTWEDIQEEEVCIERLLDSVAD